MKVNEERILHFETQRKILSKGFIFMLIPFQNLTITQIRFNSSKNSKKKQKSSFYKAKNKHFHNIFT